MIVVTIVYHENGKITILIINPNSVNFIIK